MASWSCGGTLGGPFPNIPPVQLTSVQHETVPIIGLPELLRNVPKQLWFLCSLRSVQCQVQMLCLKFSKKTVRFSGLKVFRKLSQITRTHVMLQGLMEAVKP